MLGQHFEGFFVSIICTRTGWFFQTTESRFAVVLPYSIGYWILLWQQHRNKHVGIHICVLLDGLLLAVFGDNCFHSVKLPCTTVRHIGLEQTAVLLATLEPYSCLHRQGIGHEVNSNVLPYIWENSQKYEKCCISVRSHNRQQWQLISCPDI